MTVMMANGDGGRVLVVVVVDDDDASFFLMPIELTRNDARLLFFCTTLIL